MALNGCVCSKAILKFLLPCAGETRAPSEIRGEGVGQFTQAGGEQLLVGL